MTDNDILHNVYLALGSNLGDRQANIDKALLLIGERIGEIAAVSSLLTTRPEGFVSDNLFANAACHVLTHLSPIEVLNTTQQIERQMGRMQKSVAQAYTDRIIDIDILLYDDTVVDSPRLTIPHPRMHERDFMLLPLSEIAPDVIHPTLHKTISALTV